MLPHITAQRWAGRLDATICVCTYARLVCVPKRIYPVCVRVLFANVWMYSCITFISSALIMITQNFNYFYIAVSIIIIL